MAADQKWYFTKEQLSSTPSTKCGYDGDRELSCRQQAAHLIQDMGQRLQVSQLCINTAIVYMHRFYVFHSFSQFHLDAMAAAALFLAAKVEEMPRKLEHVIKVKQICLHRDQSALDVKSEQYLEQAQDLVFNENVLLQTLGFDVAIDHPHTHVVRCCHLVRASKDLAQTSYFMASNSLHLTTMCLQYKPTVVACFCIHLACKWSNWEIPQSNEGKYWFYYVDKTVTQDLLEQLTDEFLVIFEKCPSRLKKKIKSANQNSSSYQFDKIPQRDSMHEGVSFQSHHRPQDPSKPSSSQIPPSSSQRTDTREYQEKRERERQMASQGSHSQHRDGHHRSHHAGHPHPPSSTSSAVMKPHAGMPLHNKLPHPGQHRSISHHPRPDHHVRPDHPQRPDHPPSRPDHQQRADYQPRQDRQSRPEHGVRPDHHPRSEHPPRTEQVRADHHQVRPDHLARSEHQNRSDHHIRPEHQNRPDHQGRIDHTSRPEHPASQVRIDHQQRLDSSARPDQVNRQDHPNRLEHQGTVERHDRQDGTERHAHTEQRYSGVTASRDQLRREAALQREASRRDMLHNFPNSIMMNSPAQRTTSGDSAISSGSSTSLTPSSQDGSGFGAPSTVFGGPPAVTKHPGPTEPSHRHSSAYEKVKSSSSSVESHTRHRNSLPGTDRRTVNTSVSLDRKMMQEISERRQLESFFGKTEAQERMNEKHQVKHPSTVLFKEVKKEPETVQPQPQIASVPSTFHIKREKVSPLRQPFNAAPQGRLDLESTSSSMSGRQMNYKAGTNDYTLSRNIKTEQDAESVSEARNGTTVSSTLLIPKVDKLEAENLKEVSLGSSRLPPVKGSIFSPEKTLPKERESPLTQRAVKTNCPPSPGIVFGSPPATPGKSQSSNSRNRTASSCSDGEPVTDLFKMERDPGYENVGRDARTESKNLHVNENSSHMLSNKNLDSRLAPSLSKVKLEPSHHLLNKTSSYAGDHKAVLYPPTSTNPVLQGRSNAILMDERQPAPSPEVNMNQIPAHPDARSLAPVKGTDVRTAIPIAPIEGDLGAVAFPASETKELVSALPSDEGSADHHHHKSKKKKEKKEKHKHKDKDKHREEKKHKSKHKEKDKERRKAEATPPHVVQTASQSKPAITLKIPKKNITTPPPPVSAAPIKLKINLSQIPSASSSSSSKESRKRERDRSSPDPEGSHPKAPKLNTAVDAPKRSVGSAGHSSSSKSSYERQNGLESRGGRHMQHPQHYSGSKMVMDDGSSLKPSEMSKNSSSHSSTS